MCLLIDICRTDVEIIGRGESFRDSLEYSMNPELQKVGYVCHTFWFACIQRKFSLLVFDLKSICNCDMTFDILKTSLLFKNAPN